MFCICRWISLVDLRLSSLKAVEKIHMIMCLDLRFYLFFRYFKKEFSSHNVIGWFKSWLIFSVIIIGWISTFILHLRNSSLQFLSLEMVRASLYHLLKSVYKYILPLILIILSQFFFCGSVGLNFWDILLPRYYFTLFDYSFFCDLVLFSSIKLSIELFFLYLLNACLFFLTASWHTLSTMILFFIIFYCMSTNRFFSFFSHNICKILYNFVNIRIIFKKCIFVGDLW